MPDSRGQTEKKIKKSVTEISCGESFQGKIKLNCKSLGALVERHVLKSDISIIKKAKTDGEVRKL